MNVGNWIRVRGGGVLLCVGLGIHYYSPARTFGMKIYGFDGMRPQHAFGINEVSKKKKKRLVAGSDLCVAKSDYYTFASSRRRRRRRHSSRLQQISIHWRQTWEFMTTNNGSRKKGCGNCESRTKRLHYFHHKL